MSQNNWIQTEEGLYCKFQFTNFIEAFGFMSKVAILAEKHDHHPTWTNTYNTVEIWLISHDNGNCITEKDYNLAHSIDQCLIA